MNQREAIQRIKKFVPLGKRDIKIVEDCLERHALAVLKRYMFLHEHSGHAILCSVEEELMDGL